MTGDDENRKARIEARRAAIAGMYDAGHSIRAIAKTVGVSYGTVHADLVSAGVTLRPAVRPRHEGGYDWDPLLEAAYAWEAEQAMNEVRALHRQRRELAKLWLVMPKLERPVDGFPPSVFRAEIEAEQVRAWVAGPPPPARPSREGLELLERLGRLSPRGAQWLAELREPHGDE